MNQFLQENIYTIILFFLLLILVLIALIGIVIVKLLLSPKEASKPATTPIIEAAPIIETKSKFKKLSEERVQEKFYCENHSDEPSIGACLICENVFCEKCLVEHDGMFFCKEHFKIFANNKWKQITDVKTTPETPEEGLYIYHFKRHLWNDLGKPSFVLTHYKINLEEDFIESFIQLNVIESEAERLLSKIEDFKMSIEK